MYNSDVQKEQLFVSMCPMMNTVYIHLKVLLKYIFGKSF